jgi:pyridoxal/pyridoxine/pyridoxamine kinase
MLDLAVIGDAGQFYVPPDVIRFIVLLLPKVTIITSNWFEVEYVPARALLST